mmetsp:Transcript_19618/g.45654  ORF Transcript_19618/g.45654 Transcript_19618/m.45654 type:complete len:255 (-) Transcript_19618:543-1307(-)
MIIIPKHIHKFVVVSSDLGKLLCQMENIQKLASSFESSIPNRPRFILFQVFGIGVPGCAFKETTIFRFVPSFVSANHPIHRRHHLFHLFELDLSPYTTIVNHIIIWVWMHGLEICAIGTKRVHNVRAIPIVILSHCSSLSFFELFLCVVACTGVATTCHVESLHRLIARRAPLKERVYSDVSGTAVAITLRACCVFQVIRDWILVLRFRCVRFRFRFRCRYVSSNGSNFHSSTKVLHLRAVESTTSQTQVISFP